MLKKLSALLVAGCLGLSNSALACTLFSAAGDSVAGGGSLIVKNRDFKPEPQMLKIVREDGNAFYGLYAMTGPNKWSLKGGVNSKGLVVVSATASSIPKAQRQGMPTKAYIKGTLKNCSSVAEALSNKANFVTPQFLMLADRKEIAYVEVAGPGIINVERKTQGCLTHTNHYLADDFSYLNGNSVASSHARYARISDLVNAGNGPFTLEDFIRISQDQNDGPDNSIWRIGSTPTNTQTLATFAVQLLPDDGFKVWVKYRTEPNMRGQEEIVSYSSNGLF